MQWVLAAAMHRLQALVRILLSLFSFEITTLPAFALLKVYSIMVLFTRLQFTSLLSFSAERGGAVVKETTLWSFCNCNVYTSVLVVYLSSHVKQAA